MCSGGGPQPHLEWERERGDSARRGLERERVVSPEWVSAPAEPERDRGLPRLRVGAEPDDPLACDDRARVNDLETEELERLRQDGTPIRLDDEGLGGGRLRNGDDLAILGYLIGAYA